MFETKAYVSVSIEEFQKSINKWNIDDWQLWEFFRKKYKNNPDYFDRINEIRLNVLRLFFIERGVWIQQKISATTTLTNTFKEKEFQSIQQHHQFQKNSPSTRLEISKSSTIASTFSTARSEISTSSTFRSTSEILKSFAFVSAFFLNFNLHLTLHFSNNHWCSELRLNHRSNSHFSSHLLEHLLHSHIRQHRSYLLKLLSSNYRFNLHLGQQHCSSLLKSFRQQHRW